MTDLTTNPEHDLDLDRTVLGVVSTTSEAVGTKARLVERGHAEDDIRIFEDEEGAAILRPDDLEEGERYHAEEHLVSGHRLIAVTVADDDALAGALEDLNDLMVREPDRARDWISHRDTDFNQRVFNTGGVVAERSAKGDEKDLINSREGAEHQADHDPWPPSPLAPTEAEQRQMQEDDKNVFQRAFDGDDPRGLMARIKDEPISEDGQTGDESADQAHAATSEAEPLDDATRNETETPEDNRSSGDLATPPS